LIIDHNIEKVEITDEELTEAKKFIVPIFGVLLVFLLIKIFLIMA